MKIGKRKLDDIILEAKEEQKRIEEAKKPKPVKLDSKEINLKKKRRYTDSASVTDITEREEYKVKRRIKLKRLVKKMVPKPLKAPMTRR